MQKWIQRRHRKEKRRMVKEGRKEGSEPRGGRGTEVSTCVLCSLASVVVVTAQVNTIHRWICPNRWMLIIMTVKIYLTARANNQLLPWWWRWFNHLFKWSVYTYGQLHILPHKTIILFVSTYWCCYNYRSVFVHWYHDC